MKQQLRFLMLTLLCAVFSAAWGTEVTFTAGTDKGATSVTKNGITVSMSTMNRDDNYRCYANTAMTVSSTAGNITKIVVTCTGDGESNYGPGLFSLTTGGYSGNYTFNGKVGTWTGNTDKVSLTASAQVRMTKIVVTYEGEVSGAQDPNLSFASSQVTLTLGDEPIANEIQSSNSGNPLADLTFSYSATDYDNPEQSTDIVSVDNDGYVSPLKSGRAKIKASWGAVTDKWNAGSITYTVIVNKKTAIIESIEDMTIEQGSTGAFTVSSNSDGEITVSSSNENVATVAGSGNSFTITTGNVGSTVITVNQAATDTYKAATAVKFTVRVKVPKPEDALFYETFDGVDGTGGRDNRFTGTVGTKEIYKESTGWLSDEEDWVFNTNKDDGSINYGVGAYQCMKLGTRNEDRFATTRSINLVGNGTLTFSAAGWANESDIFTITATGGDLEGDTQITLESETWKTYTINITGATGDLKITFTGHRGFFDDILVMPVPVTPITATFKKKFMGYTSIYYSDKNLVVPENVTAHTYKVEDGKGSFSVDYAAGDVIPKGTGVILEYSDKNIPDEGITVTLEETTDEGTADPDNMLRGFDEAQVTTVDEGENPENYYFYRYTVGTGSKSTTIGFYFANETGSAFTAGAHKIYLAVPTSQFEDGVNASFIADDTTGIEEIVASTTRNGTYTVSGIQVSTDKLPKGIYIVNGKKTVIK